MPEEQNLTVSVPESTMDAPAPEALDAMAALEKSIQEGVAAALEDELPPQEEPVKAEPAKPEPKPAETLDEKDQLLLEMRETMQAMRSELAELRQSARAKAAPAEKKLEEEEIVTQDDYTKMFAEEGIDLAAFNRIQQKTAALAIERVMAKLPDILLPLLGSSLATYEAQEEFFRANEDLRPHKKILNTVMRRLNAENPELIKDGDWAPLFKRAGEEIRKIAKSAKTIPGKRSVTAIPNGSRTAAPKVGTQSSIGDDLKAMLSAASSL